MNEIIDKIPLETLIGMSATLIAILIPLSLFVLESLSSSTNSSILSWDNRVIIKQVLQVKLLFVSLLLTAFPLIFWNVKDFRFVVVLLCSLGYVGTIRAMLRAYQWIMSRSTDSYSWIGQLNQEKLTYRNKMRSKYLDKLKSDDEILEVWGTIFQTQGWIGIDPKLLIEKYVQAVQQVEKNAEKQLNKSKSRKDETYEKLHSEELLFSFLKSSLEGKYKDSQFNFETLYSFGPLQKFVMSRYAETLDDQRKNFNVRFLLEYLMKYINNHEFYGYSGLDSPSYLFNHDFYKLLRSLQKKDEDEPKNISRVSETLAYYGKKGNYGNFGVLFFETLNSQAIKNQTLNKNFGHLNYPKEWGITKENIENNTIVKGWWHSFLKYFLEHRKSENNYSDSSRNRYNNFQEENTRLDIITNYFLGISSQKFAEILELIFLKQGGEIELVPLVVWKVFIENPEYEIIDYLNYYNEPTKIFELLYLNFPWFFDSKYLKSYGLELSKVSFTEGSKELARKKRMLKNIEELLAWQALKEKEKNG